MTTKKPAITTQLKSAKTEIENLQTKLSEMTKEFESERSARERYSKLAAGLEKELDQLHGLLDGFPGSLPRRNQETYIEYCAMTRLASWLMATK